MRRILGNFVAIATQFKDFYDRDALDPFIATDTGRKFFEHIKLAWENYLKILQLHETENKDSDVCRKIIETFEQATDIANVLSSGELWRLYDLDSDELYEVGETPQETEKANQETRDWVERNCRNVDWVP